MEDKRKEGKTNWNGRGIGISEGGNEYDKEQNIYSESQIIEYIARAHKMSSLKFILKYMTAVMLLIGLHKKKAA